MEPDLRALRCIFANGSPQVRERKKQAEYNSRVRSLQTGTVHAGLLTLVCFHSGVGRTGPAGGEAFVFICEREARLGWAVTHSRALMVSIRVLIPLSSHNPQVGGKTGAHVFET